MTMQTTTLPFQVSGANAAARAPALPGAAADGGKAFGDTLSREIAQRQMAPQQGAPAPAPAAQQNKPAAPNKPASGDKPNAAQAQRSPAREPAKQQVADNTEAAASTAQAGAAQAGEESKEAAADAAAAAAAAATNPVTDMLAYIASLAQPAANAVPAATTPAAEDAAASAAAPGELQLAVLESSFARLAAQDGAATDASAGAEAPAEDAGQSGPQLSAGVERAPAEPRGAPEAPAAKTQPDANAFAAQLRQAGQDAAPQTEAPAPSVTQLQAQAAKLEAVQNPAAAPGDRIPARVGTQAWDNQVSQRIVYMVGKEQAATLTLNPPDLGPVQVVLNVSNDQASVQFSSSQAEVRQALENALPRLREMMSESGIALGNATVDAGVPDGRQAPQDGERRSAGHGGGVGGNGRDGAAQGTAEAAAPRATRTVALGDSGMVDTFA
ncbi:hypothetical protein B0920_19075 [Massilia sp. KIM]|uniref:flagellar hook-length control protein FliK n=1 Tax=Massilia sp. KIM TaxID=1955422 RepID=UPI0009902139|nr:flagellar hook-length control protein FliK [Massilia sp. KIM]OON61038.1 hypothetical protein B0920_19075 [Massilia sp. KIM]